MYDVHSLIFSITYWLPCV